MKMPSLNLKVSNPVGRCYVAALNSGKGVIPFRPKMGRRHEDSFLRNSIVREARTCTALPGKGAFTMIEIALALGIIGFALVAIIGILPAGLNVQRQSREDTIIAQDGPFFMGAIRNGAPAVLTNGAYSVVGGGNATVLVGGGSSLDFLTNYIEQITSTSIIGTVTNVVTNLNDFPNGATILGLLSRPEFPGTSVITTARVRGLSGAATDQNGSNAVTAFRYYMDVEVTPFNTFGPTSLDAETNFTEAEASSLNQNLFDVRLKFRWPVRANGTAGPGRQTYQSLVSGHMAPFTNYNNNIVYWFLQPANYSTNAL
jgi:hypothetical protein